MEEFTLPDFKTDAEISRLEGLLAANQRLDHLRERAEYIQQHYGSRPRTFFEMCQAQGQESPHRGAFPTAMLTVIGASLGALVAYSYRKVWPQRPDIGYLGGTITGGTLGFAAGKRRENRQELGELDTRIASYETYLDRFELALQRHRPAPELNRGTPCDPTIGR